MISSRTLGAPRLRERTEALDRRFDELTVSLAAAIAEVEAGALEASLDAWLEWAKARHRAHTMLLAVRMPRSSTFPQIEGVEAVAVSDLAAGGDPVALGALRRDCSGLLWLDGSELPHVLADVFGEAPLGIRLAVPPDWESFLPEGTPAAAAALVHAGSLLELTALVQAKHSDENARLSMQAAIAERSRGSRSLLEELTARRDSLTELRDDVQRDLQVVVDDADKFVDEIDTEALFRGGVRKALEGIPALNIRSDHLVSTKAFNQEVRFHWWTGSFWQHVRFLFDRKQRLTIPSADLMTLSGTMVDQAKSIVSRQAQRRLDRFDAAMDDFDDTASSLGVDLRAAKVKAEVRSRWVQHKSGTDHPSGPRDRVRNLLEERCRRVVDVVRERDLRGFHVDIVDRGPIGAIQQGRTALLGLGALITFGVKFVPQANSQQFGLGILAGLFFLGFLVTAFTGQGRDDALVSEKVNDGRDALEDKLVVAMGRFVSDEIDSVKTLLVDSKADVIGRMDRAIEGIKQECDELERRGRTTTVSRPVRPSLAPLPITLRSDVDKVRTAMRDLRAELGISLAAGN